MTSSLAERYYHAALYWSARDESRTAYSAWRDTVDLWLDGKAPDLPPPPGGLMPYLAHLPVTPRMMLEQTALRMLEERMLWYDERGWVPLLPDLPVQRDDQLLAYEMLCAWVRIALEDAPKRRDELLAHLEDDRQSLG